jgi:hypothetical protein
VWNHAAWFYAWLAYYFSIIRTTTERLLNNPDAIAYAEELQKVYSASNFLPASSI